MAAKLASQLIDADPATAAALLEKSLPDKPGPAGMGALYRLREKDSFLADYVAGKVLDALASQPTLVSLSGLYLMSGYVFPGAEASGSVMEAESSLQLLQYRYFLASYDVLKISLTETNEALLKDHHYTQGDFRYRAAFQAQIAAMLAALAPRLQATLAVELTEIANKLAHQLPPNFSQFSKFSLARLGGQPFSSEHPEERFAFALSNGDLDEARKQLDRLKEGKQKEAYLQLLIRNEAKARLAESDVMAAVTAIRKLGDQTTRLVMYLETLKVTKKKRDAELTRIVLNEARLLVPQTERNGLHIRALLSFAAQQATPDAKDEAADFLSSAVTSINGLVKPSKERTEAQTMAEAAMAELNDPSSLLDEPEMERAFVAVGSLDLDLALIQANKIQPKPVQLMARLQTIQSVIKKTAAKPKPAPPPVKVAPLVNSSKP